MSSKSPPATRSNLVRLRQRLVQVERGAQLLRRKRESLVSELLSRARPAIDARRAIESVAQRAYRHYLDALTHHGAQELRVFGWPHRELAVATERYRVWGIDTIRVSSAPRIKRSLGARGVSPQSVGGAAEHAGAEVETLLDLLLNAAPEEHLMQRLGRALHRTTRQVNTLEQRLTLQLEAQRAAVERTLQEREREDRVRLNHLRKHRQR